MTDLILKGSLNLAGNLKFAVTGGKVKADDNEVLVKGNQKQGTGIPPVILPPPPGTPIDEGQDVRILNSFNSSITIKDAPVVALGICMQGTKQTWPGMILPSTKNSTVTINRIPINVKGDSAVTLPNGGTVQFDESGQ